MYANSFIFAKILLTLAEHFPEDKVNQWLENAEVIKMTDDELILFSPSHENLISLREHCRPYILDSLNNLFQCNVTLEIWGPQELELYNQSKKKEPDYLKPGYLFSDFLVGNSNEIAFKIAKAIAAAPGNETYNPLCIYGPSGTGKTHLLCAIANEIHINNPRLNVCYIQADVFVGELIWSLRSGTHDEFRRKYRSVDVMIVEDIQFFAGKATTQEEFYYLIDYLYQNQTQLIFSANCYPALIPGIEDYLSSKFEQGIVIGVDVPELDIRKKLVSRLAQKYKLMLNDEAISYIAEIVPENFRKITGALKRLRAARDIDGVALTTAQIKEMLEQLL